jgi:hypothetical protein
MDKEKINLIIQYRQKVIAANKELTKKEILELLPLSGQ